MRPIDRFKSILDPANLGHSGTKYEAACDYNLGCGYHRKHNEPMAINKFNEVIEAWPTSMFAGQAEKAPARSQ
jgi:hypothetical protein